MEIDRIEREDYCGYKQYYWKDRKTLKLFETDAGTYDIHYFKYPAKLTVNTDDNTPLDICDDACYIIPFKIASLIIQPEKADISARLLQIYEGEKDKLISSQSKEPQYINRVYSI